MRFHFTPEKGWMNDPNGLIRIQDEYHIFYQYYPDDIVWGPMHWGHAVSKDLLQFEHKPIAIYPDELGYAFSGSCILDKDNVSGLGTEETPALLAFYTSHNPDTGEQQQSIAYSLDYETFIKYEHNPVIANCKTSPDYQVDFRDPKVFENPIRGGYSMVLAAGKHIEFFHSMNLLSWERTGTFDPGVHGFAGICECPDCFLLPVEDGKGKQQTSKWVLLISSILHEEQVGKPLCQQGFSNAHVMQYFVGEFDGETFRDTEQSKEPMVLDYGTDNYAMVSFANCEERILYGWGEHWDYVAEVPAAVRRGKMTVPRRVRLLRTRQGYRLAQLPMEMVPKTTYKLVPGSELKIKNSKGHILCISMLEHALVVDRSRAVDESDSAFFQREGYRVFSAEHDADASDELIVVRDGDYFEIFAENGILTFSVMTY